MEISPNDRVAPISPGTDPDYNDNNPLHQLIRIYETVQLAAER